MSLLVGGIGISHTPSMGFQYDLRAQGTADPRWLTWFEGVAPVARWIAELAPSKMIVIYNDHMNFFTFDQYPTFAIGMAARFAQADEGRGLRPLPDLGGDPAFAWPIARSLVAQGFDLTFCQRMEIDHGIYSWLPCVMQPPWPVDFLPIAVNMIMQPVPTAQRLYDLGRCLRRAIQDDGRQERVMIVSTGGMSHQIHGSRFGLTNGRWDRYFLEHLAGDFERLRQVDVEKIMKVAGTDAAELTMWYVMRAALAEHVQVGYSFYTRPEITGCGVIALQDEA